MQVTVTLQIELTKNETVHLLSILTASVRLQEHQWMHAPLRKIYFGKIKEIRRGGKREEPGENCRLNTGSTLHLHVIARLQREKINQTNKQLYKVEKSLTK